MNSASIWAFLKLLRGTILQITSISECLGSLKNLACKKPPSFALKAKVTQWANIRHILRIVLFTHGCLFVVFSSSDRKSVV